MKQTEADKKVLHMLLDHAREPISQIARKTGLTREIVDYSMKKLEKEGIIKAYIARINQTYFCEGVATVFFKLIRTDEKRFKEIIAYLKDHKAVNWVAELVGNADLVITVLYKDSEDLANNVSEITQFIGNNLKEHHISLYISEYKFTRTGIIYGKEEKSVKPITFKENKKEIKIDSKDVIILSELSKDCRIKNSELAKMTKLSEDMIRIRIKNLEKKEVILGYTIVLDVNAYGLESYYTGLQVQNITKEVNDKIKYYVNTNPYIIFAARSVGRYNVILNIYARNRQHFREILQDISNNLGAYIIDYEFQLDLQEHKEVFVTDAFIKAKVQ